MNNQYQNGIMIRNYILTALRNIRKTKVYTFINIFGLSVGIASAVLILLFISSELSYDRFNDKADRIYRIYIEANFEGSEFKGPSTCKPAGPVFTDEIPEVINYTRLDPQSQTVVRYGDNKFVEDHFVYADSGVFQIFSLHMFMGDPNTALKEPNTIVLTRSTAKKYFGKENPIGKILTVNADTNMYRVTGVIADLPPETHLQFDFLASFCTLPESRNDFWLSNNLYTYVLLEKGAKKNEVEGKMQAVSMKYIGPQVTEVLGIDLDEFTQKGNRYGLFLQPLTDIHLSSEIEGGFKASHDRKYLLIFGLIALFILVIASINFMNLSTARSANRAKEVGMRKVVGSTRTQLMNQFIWESVILSIFSLFFALILVELVLPYFNKTMDLSLTLDYTGQWYTIPGLIALALLVGLLSGSYPSFVLSSFRPVKVLKGQAVKGLGGGLLRNILVVVQFTISIVIIIGTIVVYSQLHYMLNKDMGFDKDRVLVIDRVWPLEKDLPTFIQEIKKLPGVVNASHSTTYPGQVNNDNGFRIKGRSRSSNYMFITVWTDYDYLSTYKVGMKEGRYFDPSFPSDSNAAVINETAVRKYNLDDPLNTTLMMPSPSGKTEALKVIGVIRDYHLASLRNPIDPCVFLLNPGTWTAGGYISVQLEKGIKSTRNTVNQIENTWKTFKPADPFLYFFLDDKLNTMYQEEVRTSRLSMTFSILAIFIASLGLFGLTLFTTEKKTKEIGIRKVLGAQMKDVIFLISREITILIAISTVIAWLLSYKLMEAWLQSFPYKIKLSVWIFLAASSIAFIVAILTVSTQAWRAARLNPAESLHYE